AGYVSRANDYLLKHKAAAAVMAVRRGGAIHAFDTLNHFFHLNQMFLTGSTYWNMVVGREIGEVEDDAEGLANMRNLGENMVFLLNKLRRE
ncbi:MAG: flavodoxin family protein, partial [Candidatus Omnitrophota bacterium]